MFDKLTAGRLDGACLTLISASAGFGKTTLAASWMIRLQEEGKQCAWVSLDEGDDDPERFFYRLASAFDTTFPSIGKELKELLQKPPLPQTELLVAQWVNAVHAVDNSFVLALDDYQNVRDLSIHQAITYLLEHIPSNLQIVIITRQDPPLPLARMHARGQLTEIRAADLRFTFLRLQISSPKLCGCPSRSKKFKFSNRAPRDGLPACKSLL